MDTKQYKGDKTMINDVTVEDLESELEEISVKINEIAQDVADKKLDTFDGFMQSEKYKDRIVEITHALKDRGIDITKRFEQD